MADTNNDGKNEQAPHVGIFRRLLAILYDSFLLIAIYFVFFIIATALNQQQAIEPDNVFYPFFSFALLLGLSYAYFAWFWIHGGQTLGMKTWHIQIQGINSSITWRNSALRFACAVVSWSVFGLGFLWVLFDKKNRGWHDLISKTVLIDVKNRNNNVR